METGDAWSVMILVSCIRAEDLVPNPVTFWEALPECKLSLELSVHHHHRDGRLTHSLPERDMKYDERAPSMSTAVAQRVENPHASAGQCVNSMEPSAGRGDHLAFLLSGWLNAAAFPARAVVGRCTVCPRRSNAIG